MPEQDNASTTETDVTDGTDGSQQDQDSSQNDDKGLDYWKSEAEKWKALSRKNEKEAKTTAKPQQEQAPKDSEAKPTVDPLEAYRAERVRDKARDKFEAHAEALGADLGEVMKHVSLEAFLDEGSVKTDEIKAYVERFAPPKKGGKFAQGVGVGPQGGGNSPTIDQRIAEAEKAGNRLEAIALKREKAHSISGK